MQQSLEKKKDIAAYEKHKEVSRKRVAAISAKGREISPLPKVRNRRRRKKALASFKFFATTYFPETFSLPWSTDHLHVITKMEYSIVQGGLFAMAMPRGLGKTSLCEAAALWALMSGRREFVCLIGSDAGHARTMLESIKVELETNSLLLEDFPEVVYPIHRLEGIFQRAGGQTYKGKQTWMSWSADELVLPTIARSRASGGIIRVAGIEARIRGMKFKRPDGRPVRPSLVILDDPQTDESARSPQQTTVRMATLNGAILNLAGPGQKISAIMPCTVIYPGDMADQILNSKLHPIWQGERTKLVYSFPTNTVLWEEYAETRARDFGGGGDGHVATEFYIAHRDEMDAGSVVAWPELHDRDEVSALQHAMNLMYRDERMFWAEHQNEPLPQDDNLPPGFLTADAILKKTSGLERGVCPIGTTHLSAFIDVQGRLLYWMVCA